MLQKAGRFLKSYWAYILCFIFYFSLAVDIVNILINRQPFFHIVPLYIIILITIIIYIICIRLALSRYGEKILRYIKGAYEIETKDDKEQLLPIFEEVHQEAFKYFPYGRYNVNLYIAESISVEAYAVGKRTIVVTRGAVDTFTEEELKGILAHEFGHILNGDSKVLLVHMVGNSFFLLTMFCYRKISKALKYLSDYLIGSIWGLFALVTKWLVDYMVFVCTLFGDVIVAMNSRKNEFRADDFAYTLGYGEELKNALIVLKKFSVHGKVSLPERLKAKHPHTGARIKRLEYFLENEQIETLPH